jgi:hypothetical protein
MSASSASFTTALPITSGGTGATTAANARSNLGALGVDMASGYSTIPVGSIFFAKSYNTTPPNTFATYPGTNFITYQVSGHGSNGIIWSSSTTVPSGYTRLLTGTETYRCIGQQSVPTTISGTLTSTSLHLWQRIS